MNGSHNGISKTVRTCSRGWEKRCAHGNGRRCRCSCGGANHGRSNPTSAAHGGARRKPTTQRQTDMFGEYDSRTGHKTMFYALGEAPARVPLEDVERTDMRVVVFGRDLLGNAKIWVANHDSSTRAPLEQRAVYHSPTGLEFGYGGSGPADTALNILLLVVPIKEAVRLHQHFKVARVATVPRNGGTLTLADVRAWVAAEYHAELAELAADEIV